MNPQLTAAHSPDRVSIPIEISSVAGDPFAAFVKRYLEDDERRTSIVAAPGMGKTTAALRIAGEMIRNQRTDFALVLSRDRVLRQQLIEIGANQGLRLMKSTAKLIIDEPAGFCLSTRLLDTAAVSSDLLELGTHSSLFILVEDAHHTSASARAFVADLLARHPRNRLLALITPFQTLVRQCQYPDPETQWHAMMDVEYSLEPLRRTGPELLLQSAVIAHAEAAEGRLIQAVSESWFELIREMLREPAMMHQIRSRKWEEIVAGAYVRAGFDEVILVAGPRDRGRDIIATKYGLGAVRVIDQVKAFKPGHLVSANDVRALMGVLHTDGASKGFVTTTSEFAPNLRSDPLIRPLIPARLELVNGVRLAQRLRELALNNPPH